MIKSKKILIWGTGNIAKEIIKNNINGEVLGFIETIKSKDFFLGKKIYNCTDKLPDYDYIIVANSYIYEIYTLCLKNDLALDNIIFLKPFKEHKGFLDLYEIKSILGEKNYIKYCLEFGINQYSFYWDDIKQYKKLNIRKNFAVNNEYNWPIITDKYALAGNMGNYFFQDLWAAKLIFKSKVKRHFDIGSRIDGFVAHLLAMEIEVTLIDIREFPGKVDGLHTIIDDATYLKQIPNGSIESISALCSLEHFGLGRYGDIIDPEACFKCFNEIQKKLKRGGNFYLSLPIGKERVEFNAHRIFYAETVIENFPSLELKEFSCTAGGEMEYNPDIHQYDNDKHMGDYRYGLFYFKKK